MLAPTLDKHKGDGAQEFMLIKTPLDLYPLGAQALSNCGTHFGAYFWQVDTPQKTSNNLLPGGLQFKTHMSTFDRCPKMKMAGVKN